MVFAPEAPEKEEQCKTSRQFILHQIIPHIVLSLNTNIYALFFCGVVNFREVMLENRKIENSRSKIRENKSLSSLPTTSSSSSSSAAAVSSFSSFSPFSSTASSFPSFSPFSSTVSSVPFSSPSCGILFFLLLKKYKSFERNLYQTKVAVTIKTN
jgi:hypothetical protein